MSAVCVVGAEGKGCGQPRGTLLTPMAMCHPTGCGAHGDTTPCTSLWGIAHGVTTPCMSLWDTEHRDTIPFFSHGVYWFSLCVLQWGGRAQWRNYFA